FAARTARCGGMSWRGPPAFRFVMLHRNTSGADGEMPASAAGMRPRSIRGQIKLARPKSCARHKIKGAARRAVRPKSREETPKEGSKTSDEVTGLAPLI